LQVAIESFLQALTTDPAVAEWQVDRMLDGAVRLRWEYVEDIPRTSSGKYLCVVCHVPREL
jgi:hypothetical protein